LLRRQMRFGALSAVEVFGFALGVTAAVFAALYGARYWSLVVMHLTIATATTAGLWLVCGWRPGRPARGVGLRPLLAFGGHLTGYDVVSYLARNADFLLVGWFWGARQVGFYDKAFQLLLVPVLHVAQPLGGVAFPALSRLRHDARRFREYFDRCVLLTAAAGMPFVAFLFVTAERAVPFVLGGQWAEAAPVFRALAPAALLGPLYSSVLWVTASLGQTRRQLVWGVAWSAVTVAGFLLGLRWGAVGVALSFSLTRAALLVPTLRYCYKDSPLRWHETLRNVARPALASALAALPLALVESRLPVTMNAGAALALEGALFVAVYACAWLATREGRLALGELSKLLRDLFRRREMKEA
ncbi:MAG TPA: oligosaccharide flippase family protein, partial [Pyrinomonadaceae bacterium]|nr:oligosaccharide flippase family protein [Pyrinomonadaceae bacterium]